MPLTDSAARTALCHGSSERYSKLRPLRGSRARLFPPASCTLKPRLRASRPIAPPEARASVGLKLAPSAIHAGIAVAVSPSRPAYPGFVTPMLAKHTQDQQEPLVVGHLRFGGPGSLLGAGIGGLNVVRHAALPSAGPGR